MALETGHKVQVAVAVLGLLGTLAVASIANWERIFPRSPPPSVELGLDYMAERRFDDAVITLKPFARRGDARAQYFLGRIYENRLVATDDPEAGQMRALYWYGKAADQQFDDAQRRYDSVHEEIYGNGQSAMMAFKYSTVMGEESGQREGLALPAE